MKKILFVLGAAVFLSSCAMVQSPVSGVLYTSLKAPLAVTSNTGAGKVGTAQATSILGAVATGDASINAAAKSAGITKIHHVDYEAFKILGFYAKYTVYVYGE